MSPLSDFCAEHRASVSGKQGKNTFLLLLDDPAIWPFPGNLGLLPDMTTSVLLANYQAQRDHARSPDGHCRCGSRCGSLDELRGHLTDLINQEHAA